MRFLSTTFDKAIPLVVASTLLFASSVQAGNLGAPTGPNITHGDRSFQVRMALAPGDTSLDEDTYAYALMYQHAFTDSVRGRIVTAFKDTNSFAYNYSRLEMLVNLRDKSQGMWSTALRFDLRQRRGSKPEEFAVVWANEWKLQNQYRLRAALKGASDFNGAPTGQLKLSSNMGFSKKMDGYRLGLEMFNTYGSLSNLDNSGQMKHQVGPGISGKLGEFKYHARYLAGVGRAAPEHDFMVRFMYAFK